MKIVLMAGEGMGYGDSLLLLSVVQDLQKLARRRIHVVAKHPEIFEGQPGIKEVHSTHHMDRFWDDVASDASEILYFRYWEITGRMRGFKRGTLLNVLRFMAGLAPAYEFPTFMLSSRDMGVVTQITKDFKKPVVVVHRGKGREIKLLGREKFGELVRCLQQKYKVVQIGYQYDDEIVGAVDLRGRLTFNQSMAMMMVARFIVGHDSMPAHASGIVQTPGVFLYGPTSPADFGYEHNENIFTGECSQEHSAPCGRPCPWNFDYIKDKEGKKRDWECPDRVCLKSIKFNQVFASVERLEQRIKTGISWAPSRGRV